MTALLPDFSTTTLLLGALICSITIFLWHRANDQFDLRWLLVDSKTNHVSLFKVGQLTALMVSTWGFIVLTQKDKMTEWFFIGYMVAWSGANIGSKWLDQKKEAS